MIKIYYIQLIPRLFRKIMFYRKLHLETNYVLIKYKYLFFDFTYIQKTFFYTR